MTDLCDIEIEQVREVIFEELDLIVSRNEVVLDTLWSSLTTNSLECVLLIMALEERFSAILPDDIFEYVLTVGEMTEFICASLS